MKLPFFYILIFILVQQNISYMKEIYKDRVTNNIESCITKTKVVKEMVTGERPADSKTAGTYLQQIVKILEEVKEVVERG